MRSFAVITHAYREDDLLPQFMRHYEAQGASMVLVLHDTGPEMDDAAIVAERAVWRMAVHDYGHDYVLLPDVDEFIYVKDGRTIADVLQTISPPESGVLFCEGYTMVQHPSDLWYDPAVPLEYQRRWGYPDINYSKPIVMYYTAKGVHRPGFHEFPGAWRSGDSLFYLAHMAAIDPDIAVRRRMLRKERCGEIQKARGHGVHNWDVTPESIREWVEESGKRADLVELPIA